MGHPLTPDPAVAEADPRNCASEQIHLTGCSDPDLDPAERAFYYVRVIEIPTPRWTAQDAKRFGVEPPEGTLMIHQERAHTSPIWYTPEGREAAMWTNG